MYLINNLFSWWHDPPSSHRASQDRQSQNFLFPFCTAGQSITWLLPPCVCSKIMIIMWMFKNLFYQFLIIKCFLKTSVDSLLKTIKCLQYIENLCFFYTIYNWQNRTVIMPCLAHGRPKPRTRWEKDGENITMSKNYRLAFGGKVHYITLQTGGLAIPATRFVWYFFCAR